MADGNVQIQLDSVRQVANEAKTSSLLAVQGLKDHETTCIVKHDIVLSTQGEIKQDIRGLYKLMWKAAIGVIILLLAICGTLVKQFFF